MKKSKVLVATLLFVMLVMVLGVVSQAVTSANLADEIYAKLSKYGFLTTDKVKVERYLNEYPVTDEQANKILTIIDKAIAVMDNAKVTNYADLTGEQKEELKTMAKEIADMIDATIVFKPQNHSVEIYKNGKLVEVVTETDGKLSYTGNNMNVVLGVSVIAIIALTTIVVIRKTANAK